MTRGGIFYNLKIASPQPAARFVGVSFMNTLFIDGRNFISKMASVFNPDNNKNKEIDFSLYDFAGLFNKVLSGIKIDRKIFYISRLTIHKDTKDKSEELIEKQRKLINVLGQQGFEIIFAGKVRGNLGRCPKGHEVLLFKEKGVDVRIAVDLITFACNKEIDMAVIASSDSDLQPAIRELNNRNIELIYLGFESSPNRGLSYTTNRTILIRNSEVIEFIPNTLI